MAKKALITGVTGQDGSYLAELLLSKGYEVAGVVRRLSAPNAWRIQHVLDRITLVQADLLDQLSLIKAVESVQPDEFYNLAAMPFYPGPGLGGHCIPIDPFYLSWKARQSGFEARFIELAGNVNGAMPEYVVERTAEALNTAKKSVNGSRIHVFGVAYKRDVNDMQARGEGLIINVTSLASRLPVPFMVSSRKIR